MVGSSPAHSTGTPPSPAVVRTPLGDPPATHKAEEPETRNIPSNNPQIDDNADDLEDIRRLAVIQGRLSFTLEQLVLQQVMFGVVALTVIPVATLTLIISKT